MCYYGITKSAGENDMLSNCYLAKVSDNKDPDNLHRVQVVKQDEEESVSDWIPVLTMYGGNDAGLCMLPDIDEQVLVVSLDDNRNKQVVLGSIWDENSAPPETGENADADFNQDGKNSLHFIKSRSKNMIILDDTDGKEKIQIISSDAKSRFEFLAEDEMVSLTTEHDLSIGAKGLLTIKAEEIEITSKKQFNVKADEVQITGKKKMDIKADQDITLKGSGIALN